MKSFDMYGQQILELYKEPLNYGELDGATKEMKGKNPLCGDEIVLQLQVEKGVVKDVRFTGGGCAISVASTSLLTDAIKGKTVEEVKQFSEDELLELIGVPISSARKKCVFLSLATVKEALKDG